MDQVCPLCKGQTKFYYRSADKKQYNKCTNCGGVFLLPQFFIPFDLEKERYLQHNNDVTDPRYQNFVKPITSGIQRDFNARGTLGLDYGCGTGPVASVQLKKEGYNVILYDPYFRKDQEALLNRYNFIICCEVMEHFHKPYKEFRQLFDLLVTGGKLYCKTTVLKVGMDFATWYYKEDPTHVFFYTPGSLEWIRENLSYKDLKIEPDVIVFSK